MPRDYKFIKTIPLPSRLAFLGGVFCLFASIGAIADVVQLGRTPPAGYVLFLVLSGGFAVGYAAAGVMLRRTAWRAIVPLLVIQLVLMNEIGGWFPLPAAPRQMTVAALAQLRQRLSLDATVLVVAIGLGYAGITYATVAESRRYSRLYGEVALAHEIHQVLVPPIDRRLGGFEFYGRSVASGEVGGDLIDVAGAEASWVAYLADVSGHGVAPGVVMAMAKSSARTLLDAGEHGDRLLPRLNSVLQPLLNPEMYVTLCFLAWHDGRLRAGLAGHPAILQLAPGGGVSEVGCANLPVGMFPTDAFATCEIAAEPGTLFVLVSDGFAETTDAAGVEFGSARLKRDLAQHRGEPLASLGEALFASVARHGKQSDDRSLLLVRKL